MIRQYEESLSLPANTARAQGAQAQPVVTLPAAPPIDAPVQDITTPEQLLHTVINNAPIALFMLDHAGIFTMAQGRGYQALGIKPEERLGTSIFDAYRDTPAILEQIIRVLDGESIRAIHQIGSMYFEIHFVPNRSLDGQVTSITGVAMDVTERVLAEKALQASERKSRTMIEQATDLILLLDPTGVFTYASPSHQRIIGYAPVELVGRNVFEFIHPADKKQVHIAWAEAFEASGNIAAIECRLRHANGSWVTVEAIGRNCIDDPDIRGFIVNARDISERNLVQEQLRYQLLHDNLTDLPNRTYLLEKLDHSLTEAARSQQELTLIVLDINRFRDINDTFGHVQGDRLLRHIAKRLSSAVCETCTIARLDGDKFAILLSNSCTRSLNDTINAFHAIMEEPFSLEDHLLHIDVSMGISLYPTHGDDALALLRKADVALNIAKRARQPFAFYDTEHDLNTSQQLELIGDLRHAILANEFMLYYQPKADIKTGTIHSVEALIRWQHPAQGLIFPDRFIPLAEQTGFITSLTLWAIESAIKQYQAWKEQGIDMEIAVNLSMWDLHNASLPAKISALFERYDVPVQCIRVEVTESAAMSDPDLTNGVLKRLTAPGIRCSLDDFGTGYSSLAYLRRLPVDELKIDRSFIQHIVDTASDQAIVRSTITMAHSLGLRVVAEGVEDALTLELLGSLGCDIVQGYYLSRPIPPEKFTQWLQQRERPAALCR